MTSFEDKCRILSELWVDDDLSESLRPLVEDYDLSFPYAFGLVHNHILQISEESEAGIEKLFDEILRLTGKEDTGYTSIYQLIEE